MLDTNRYTDLMSAVPAAIKTIESAAEVFVPFAVLGELRGGFAAGNHRAANDRVLDAFLQKPFVKAIFTDESTVAVYSSIYFDLRRRGLTIPQNDMWIAALCIQHAARLYSRDKHFDHLPQVQRVQSAAL
jgi:tRNA(fMet)-specific endonuclease VapC